jgi:hypothetical protein
LPAGLPENAEVRLEAFDRGYWTVRFEGEVFEVAMACVGRAGILWVEPRTLERALTNGTRGQTNFFLRALSVEGC